MPDMRKSMMEADNMRTRVHRAMRELETGDTAHVECSKKQLPLARKYVRDFRQWRENWVIREGTFKLSRVEDDWIMIKRTA